MRDKYIFRFINMNMPAGVSIPAECFYSEACNQRDIFRDAIRNYGLNGRSKQYQPVMRPDHYVPLIMTNLGQRANISFPKYDSGQYRHPQPAYLVLGVWHMLLATEARINKFWEVNFQENIIKYLSICSTVQGICESIRQCLHDFNESQYPLSLFDVPQASPVVHTYEHLPNYTPDFRPSSNSHPELHFHGNVGQLIANVENLNTNKQ